MSADTAHDPLAHVASWLSQEPPAADDADPVLALISEHRRLDRQYAAAPKCEHYRLDRQSRRECEREQIIEWQIAIEQKVVRTVAISRAGIIAQLEFLRSNVPIGYLDFAAAIAGVKALVPETPVMTGRCAIVAADQEKPTPDGADASEKPATMEEMATVEFEAMPELFEHFKCRPLDEEFRALGVDLRVAAALMARSKVELIEGLKVLGEEALDELLDHLQEAGETFRSFAELAEAAHTRQVIAVAALAIENGQINGRNGDPEPGA
jgi:hypothetical protein